MKIGNICLGKGCPVVVQSMTNTDTNDVAATVAQAKRMVTAGCAMVRITVPSMKEVESLKQIKSQLRADGIGVPLIADVHFQPKVAEACAAIVEKVRVNPGNYVDKRSFQQLDLSEDEYQTSLQAMAERAKPLFEICKQNNTVLRIGVNHGSLSDRIVSKYGNTPFAMAMSAKEWIDICKQFDFHNVVLSMKSSNVSTMIEATTLLHQMMHENGTMYPLHVGVTEAGAGDEGRVKSAAGIGSLLLDGIGDTIRVSLTEAPENEVPVAALLARINDYKSLVHTKLIEDTLHIDFDEPNREIWLVMTSAFAGHVHTHHSYKNIIVRNSFFSEEECKNLAELILQACRIKMTRTEIVSCPSCGRTQYDIQGTLAKVKARFGHFPNLKIGVMGCIVNGPGEMADADFGIVGCTAGKVAVYRQKQRVSPPLSIDDALNELEQLIVNSENL